MSLQKSKGFIQYFQLPDVKSESLKKRVALSQSQRAGHAGRFQGQDLAACFADDVAALLQGGWLQSVAGQEAAVHK